MKLRFLALFFVLLIVTGCGTRSIPPEISALRDFRSTKSETIVVDAGHGGKDPGAVSRHFDYEEKELTLQTANLVKAHLQQLGYNVVMTRSLDVYIPLSDRAHAANALHADLFVSIHYNYASSPDVSGVEIYYYKEKAKTPSKRIAQSKILGGGVLKEIVKHTGADSRGVKQANFAVIRETKMPAILIEAGFLSNTVERAKVKNPKYRRVLARGIAHGIDTYLDAHRS